jgi:hypothetical protein
MHPPFGFALFYLRSVAPKSSYLDKVTGQRMQPVTTAQIYWGAIPFVIIQIIMVALTIAFPQMVTHYKDTGPAIDSSTIRIQVPPFGDNGGQPNFGTPDLNAPPSFGPPPGLSGGGAPQAPGVDLNAPPSFGTPPGLGGGSPAVTPDAGPPPGLSSPAAPAPQPAPPPPETPRTN